MIDSNIVLGRYIFLNCLYLGSCFFFKLGWPSFFPFTAQHAAAAMALETTQFKHPAPKVKNTKNGKALIRLLHFSLASMLHC
jgi:hypothetical protein